MHSNRLDQMHLINTITLYYNQKKLLEISASKTYHIDIHDNWNRIRYKGTVFTLSKKNNTFDRKEIRFIIEMEYQAKDIIPIHPIM